MRLVIALTLFVAATLAVGPPELDFVVYTKEEGRSAKSVGECIQWTYEVETSSSVPNC
jgi:hypothetical protein